MSFNFVIREALRGLGRNLTMTMALIITTAISLALLATGFLVTTMTERTKDIYLDRVEVMVQFNDDVSAKDKDCTSKECTEVRDLLSKSDGVASVTFRSREQSYQRYVELFQESDPLLVKETSPDALPAALHVRLTNPLDTTPLNPIRQLPQVATIIDQVDDLSDATSNLDAIRNATFLFAAVQALAAIFLIVNMVQITAFNRRQETEIMRMVGASRWYTQAPSPAPSSPPSPSSPEKSGSSTKSSKSFTTPNSSPESPTQTFGLSPPSWHSSASPSQPSPPKALSAGMFANSVTASGGRRKATMKQLWLKRRKKPQTSTPPLQQTARPGTIIIF